MKKRIGMLVLLIGIIVASNVQAQTLTGEEALAAGKQKQHTVLRWFNLPIDEFNWPTYILNFYTWGSAPATFTLTLKDYQFSTVDTYSFTGNPFSGNPQDEHFINLNLLWPEHFNYAKGDPDIIDYVIEVQMTEPQFDSTFRSISVIYACLNGGADPSYYFDVQGANTQGYRGLPVTPAVAGDAFYDGRYVFCYGMYTGIGFGKVPKYK